MTAPQQRSADRTLALFYDTTRGTHRSSTPLAAYMVGAWLTACSGAYGPPVPEASTHSKASAVHVLDGSVPDATSFIIDGSTRFAPDAFFINDPAPPMCGPDGKRTAPPKVDGPVDCPADKNREGCECSDVGKHAACWPGKRVNRNHGICVDGKTTCEQTPEFGRAWGPCQGYVLPKKGAVSGPDACRCFSNGKWDLSNLVPCIIDDPSGTFLYSSHPDTDGGFHCDSVADVPPSAPSDNWTSSTLKVDCAGQFELCYTLKAGKASSPKSDDCVLMHACVDVWYEEAGKSQTLPDLPGWASSDSACSARFKSVGGYGEMSVRGVSIECDPVDNGDGKAYVFERTTYCKPACNDTPDAEGCKDCSVSGSGAF